MARCVPDADSSGAVLIVIDLTTSYGKANRQQKNKLKIKKSRKMAWKNKEKVCWRPKSFIDTKHGVNLFSSYFTSSKLTNCVRPSTRRYQLQVEFSLSIELSTKNHHLPYSELKLIEHNKHHSFQKRPTKWIILQCITGFNFQNFVLSRLPNVLIRYSFPILLPGKK